MENDITLSEVLGGPVESEGGFAVVDYKTASWAVGKAMAAAGEIAKLEAAAKAMRERIDAWLASQKREHEETLGRMEAFLEPWVAGEVARRRARSIEIPWTADQSAMAGYRKSPDRLEVTDEEAAIAWAKANLPGAVKTTETLSKTEVKAAIKKGGELPPGTVYVEGHDTFYVKPKEDK